MTEERKGVSAWLRGIVDESYGKESRPLCTGITKTFFGVKCREMPTCGSCILAMLTAIADRIDAERALPDGVEWPRFEDGELVKAGDEVEFEGETMRVCEVALDAAGWVLWCENDGLDGRLRGSYVERVKRPAPEVLDADGVPIKVGDTVYFVGGSGTRVAINDIDFKPDGTFVDIIDEDRSSATVNPESLTHERPDSWEQLSNDTKMGAVTYADRILGVDIRETTTEEDYEAFARDVVRRAKALVKAGDVE